MTHVTYVAFVRQVKDMKMSLDYGNNSLLALAMAGKSEAVFYSAEDCVKDDLTSERVCSKSTDKCRLR